MSEVLLIALLLFGTGLLARLGVDLVLFRNVDLRFISYLQLIVIPAAQAAILVWFLRPGSLTRRLRTTLRSIGGRPLLMALLAVDTVLLGLAWMGFSFVDRLSAGDISNNYSGLRSLAAGCIFSLQVGRFEKTSERLVVLLLGLGLATWGIDFLFPWISGIPTSLWPETPVLFQWIYTYGPAAIAATFVMLQAARTISHVSDAAATWLEYAPLCLMISMLVWAVTVFSQPTLSPVWARVVHTMGYLAITACWFSAFILRGKRETSPGGRTRDRPKVAVLPTLVVLAVSYLIMQVVTNDIVLGRWGLDGRAFLVVIFVAIVQTASITLVFRNSIQSWRARSKATR